ncbi:MAG: hypothetical protein ABIL58_05965, partial [Pseudomonadota bacterium]
LAFMMPIAPCFSPHEVKPPTGEPDAGDPHVRFGGGRARVTGFSHPYSDFKHFWTPAFAGVTGFGFFANRWLPSDAGKLANLRQMHKQIFLLSFRVFRVFRGL